MMILHALFVSLGLLAQKKYAHGPLSSIHSLQKEHYTCVHGYKALMGEAQVAHAVTIFRSN